MCQLWLYCIDMSALSLVLHHSAVSESWNETVLLHNTSLSYASPEDSVNAILLILPQRLSHSTVLCISVRTESLENVNGKRSSNCPSTCLCLPLHLYMVVTFFHPSHVLQFWFSPCFCPLTRSERQYNKLVSSGNHICINCFTSLPAFSRMNSDAVAIGCPGHMIPHHL